MALKSLLWVLPIFCGLAINSGRERATALLHILPPEYERLRRSGYEWTDESPNWVKKNRGAGNWLEPLAPAEFLRSIGVEEVRDDFWGTVGVRDLKTGELLDIDCGTFKDYAEWRIEMLSGL